MPAPSPQQLAQSQAQEPRPLCPSPSRPRPRVLPRPRPRPAHHHGPVRLRARHRCRDGPARERRGDGRPRGGAPRAPRGRGRLGLVPQDGRLKGRRIRPRHLHRGATFPFIPRWPEKESVLTARVRALTGRRGRRRGRSSRCGRLRARDPGSFSSALLSPCTSPDSPPARRTTRSQSKKTTRTRRPLPRTPRPPLRQSQWAQVRLLSRVTSRRGA